MNKFLLTFALAALALPLRADIKVATLHPLLADLARQIGGQHVEVVDILQPGSDIHHFEPSPKSLAAMRGAALILASGKGLETYLDKLRDSLDGSTKVLEVGQKIPSIPIAEEEHAEEGADHDHHHHHGDSDPHWWHSAENMKRAARILADEFSAADPVNRSSYEAGNKAASKRFAELKSWAQKEITQIPAENRKLVTAHAAFNYFCKEYGFESIAVLGIGRGDDASSRHIAETIKFIQSNAVKALFVEDQANPKVMAAIVNSTGVKLGAPLVADGTAVENHTFESMFTHNVRAIVAGLKP